MNDLILLLIIVIALKNCKGYDYSFELEMIKNELSKIANKLEKLNDKK